MRTLKKTLSLVLVVAMVLGLCVVGASAYNKVEDFTDDVAKIGDAYYEAVGVLTGIGVIDGMTETAFEPQGTYTREQAAKIIAYMQLGKDKADSLKCTVAPFDDVAATRWSAGYIAYCVEQGIIDGMTETTFEPTGKLTGFQWAKMLLCAVGFGVKGEFTGSSWSVNTAKVAHTVDLFKGDLAGADHTAITREQAALYAFNVLTNVKKVAYSPNVTNYVFGIGGYEVVGGIGSTLGKDVFGLVPYTGIITANEGTGAKYTTLSKGYAGSALVANLDADTSADMMYHAARIWAVNGVSVFVCDIAKTTTYSCYAIATAKTANASKVAGNTLTLGAEGATEYEYDLVDNSAYLKNSYAGVTFKYSTAELGTTTSSGITYVYDPSYYQANAGVKAANIWTDISKISKGTTVVYLVVGGQYYIYTTSATTGTIDGYSNKTGVITLTDGTTIARSVLGNNYTFSTNDVGKTYTFLLDNHGHYMGLTKQGVANLYYYTGEFQPTSAYNGYVGERAYSAQFINVTTGEVVDLPVYTTFITSNFGTSKGDFFDVGYADAYGVYSPDEITAADNIYANTYAIKAGARFDATVDDMSVRAKNATGSYSNVTVTFDNPTKFIIAAGTGTKVEIKTYDSLSALLAAYPGNTVRFDSIAMTVYKTSTQNMACSVVFGYLGSYIVRGTNLFLPENITANDWNYKSGVGYYYDGFYLNGKPVTVCVAATDINTDYERGFYSFKIEDDTWTITRQTADVYVGTGALNTAANVIKLDGHAFVSAPVIVDLRAGVKDDEKLSTVDAIVNEFRNETFMVAYTLNAAGAIDVAYILDAGWQYKTTVSVSDDLYAAGWRLLDNGKEVKSISFVDTTVTDAKYTLTNVNIDVAAGLDYTTFVDIYENGSKSPVHPTSAVVEDGNIVITYTAPSVDKSAREVTAVIDGLKSNLTVSASAAGVTAEADTANHILGEAVRVKVSFAGSVTLTSGKAYELTFASAHGTAYDFTVDTEVINTTTPLFVYVTINPTATGAYNLSEYSMLASEN